MDSISTVRLNEAWINPSGLQILLTDTLLLQEKDWELERTESGAAAHNKYCLTKTADE